MAIQNPGRTQRAKAAELRKKALELRTLGLSYRQIADQLAISKTAAYRHVIKAIETLENESREDARVNRRLDLERLDWIIREAMKQSLKGDLQAMDRIMKAIDRRARIYGFNAPQKVAHTTPDGTEVAPPTGVVLIPEPMSREEWLKQYGRDDTDSA